MPHMVPPYIPETALAIAVLFKRSAALATSGGNTGAAPLR